MNMLVWVVAILIQTSMCHHDTGGKQGFLNTYQSEDNDFQVNVRRNQRQTNNERFNSAVVDNDWYVFDVVEGSSTSSPAGLTSINALPETTAKTTTRTTTPTNIPQFPNAIARRLPPCEETCNLRTTPQYNPVCGDNGVTYYNKARLDCAAFCGQKVQELHRGRCGPLLPFL